MMDLRARGVVFEEYDIPGFDTVNRLFEYGEYRAAWFKDCDGNIVEVGQVPERC